MANFVGLQDLVHALARAVIDAQRQVDRAQIANLAGYLDGQQRPQMLTLRVPSLRPEAAPGDEDVYQAPLIGLVGHSLLRIKQVEVSFDVELGDLSDAATPQPQKAPAAAGAAAADIKRTLSVNPAVTASVKQEGSTAHVVLTMEAIEQPEGIARMVSELTRTQGVAGPAPRDQKT